MKIYLLFIASFLFYWIAFTQYFSLIEEEVCYTYIKPYPETWTYEECRIENKRVPYYWEIYEIEEEDNWNNETLEQTEVLEVETEWTMIPEEAQIETEIETTNEVVADNIDTEPTETIITNTVYVEYQPTLSNEIKSKVETVKVALDSLWYDRSEVIPLIRSIKSNLIVWSEKYLIADYLISLYESRNNDFYSTKVSHLLDLV